ncbi:MAG TPA: hypothetical protein VJO99_20245 [Burkholderiaceae bacterium]|nr:hypothetical protein [Burkholderiaceae bacterium]
MNIRWALRTSAAIAIATAFGAATAQTAATTPAAKPAAKAKAPAKKAAPAKQEPVPEAATPEQISAAERVYYGLYDCEFNQTVDISISPKYPAWVDVKHGKTTYLMKPVLSSTGAVRLEDLRGEALMVQIASKSMLLNTKTGTRIVDACVSPKQRELMEAAKVAKSAEGAAAPAAK